MKNKKKMTWLVLLVLLVCAAGLLLLNNLFTGTSKSDTAQESQQDTSKKETSEEDTEKNDQEASPKDRKEYEKMTDVNEKIDYLLSQMSMEEKVGQLMMVGFHGNQKSGEITGLIEDKKIGGVIYFDRNMTSPGQVAELSNSLQQSAMKSPYQLPLMMAVDQEGGMIIRMREQVSPIPSQQELGQKAEDDEVYQVAKMNGAELDAMGIHINFAPVLDLSAADSRSFGEDPEKVYQYGKKAIEGLNESSVTGALKHFPGNGRSQIDPHVDTSSVEADRLDLENSDIYPFKRIIQDLDHQQFFVMVTHIKYPAYDKEKPASLSKHIIQDLLRTKLGYNGIVVTDDLEMGAVNKYFSYQDVGKEALLAGADLLLICHEYEHQLEVYNGIVEAVQTGEIPMDRIDESVKRILTYKLTQIPQWERDPQQAGTIVKSDEHVRYMEDVVK